MRWWLWRMNVGCLVVLLSLTYAQAEPVTLEWSAVTTHSDQSALTNLCCYRVYWGTTFGVYPNSLNVGNVTRATISGLDKNTAYYFVVTAIDTDDNESAISNAVGARPDRVISW